MAALTYAGRGRTLAITWGSGRRATASAPQADMSANVVAMSPRPDGKLDTHERAKAANAALTTAQRSAAGKARAAALHSITSYAQRVADRWPTATDDERREVRRKLRAAGIIS